ncbi:hypothetical protein PsYK624_001640 [Phanerochaete sordida]|uniref:Uncharacterized protein n=1 Tax=Phanerochaete sordida TaxID=48140 RepID=A0A9P3FXE4_9APHY|nr:hypothetical protein PsYK624_001640 [Phanerochaete sordida]
MNGRRLLMRCRKSSADASLPRPFAPSRNVPGQPACFRCQMRMAHTNLRLAISIEPKSRGRVVPDCRRDRHGDFLSIRANDIFRAFFCDACVFISSCSRHLWTRLTRLPAYWKPNTSKLRFGGTIPGVMPRRRFETVACLLRGGEQDVGAVLHIRYHVA